MERPQLKNGGYLTGKYGTRPIQKVIYEGMSEIFAEQGAAHCFML